jgi:Spy/CpxP family protein refolding chaperone
MSTIRIATVVIGAILALAATAFAQSPSTGGQSGMSAQQSQPTMPSQPPQSATPAQPPQPAEPGQQDRNLPPNSPANAPANAPAASPADAVAKQLAQVLNLSGAQTTQVRTALEDERIKLIALRDNQTLSAPDKQAKLMEIRRGASDKIMSILTPEQQKKLADAIQKQQPQPGAQQPTPQPPR